MEILIYFFIFLLGLAVGSFLNCLIFRLEKGEGFLLGRSYCPKCQHQLNWLDLIPLFSFLLLKGKCRYCRQKISWQYPLVELATGILFLSPLIYWAERPIIFQELFFYWVIFSFAIVIFVYDLKHYIIPDKVIYLAIVIALIFNFQFLILRELSTFKFSLLSALGASLFFLIVVLVSRGEWMGEGDVKLAFLMGLLLGFPNILVALFFAFLIGAIVGIGLVISGKKTLKSEVPFGPFLVTGTFIALFWGERIVEWYWGLPGLN